MAALFNILAYEYAKQTVPNLGSTFQEVATVTMTGAVAGTYEIGYAFEIDFNGTKDKPVYFRLGGTYGDVTEFSTIAEANADKKNRYYMFPKVHAGGDLIVSLDMKKDAGLAILDVNFADVMIKRVS